jgi:hypothetical protein
MVNEKVLKGISIAILATDRPEEIDLSSPRQKFAGYLSFDLRKHNKIDDAISGYRKDIR